MRRADKHRLGLFSRDDEFCHFDERLSALPRGVEADRNEGAKDPDDAYNDPAREKLLGEDVP